MSALPTLGPRVDLVKNCQSFSKSTPGIRSCLLAGSLLQFGRVATAEEPAKRQFMEATGWTLRPHWPALTSARTRRVRGCFLVAALRRGALGDSIECLRLLLDARSRSRRIRTAGETHDCIDLQFSSRLGCRRRIPAAYQGLPARLHQFSTL